MSPHPAPAHAPGHPLRRSLTVTLLLRKMLFGVSPFGLATFAGVALALTAVALVASYLPARRAARVDPMEALRYE